MDILPLPSVLPWDVDVEKENCLSESNENAVLAEASLTLASLIVSIL